MVEIGGIAFLWKSHGGCSSDSSCQPLRTHGGRAKRDTSFLPPRCIRHRQRFGGRHWAVAKSRLSIPYLCKTKAHQKVCFCFGGDKRDRTADKCGGCAAFVYDRCIKKQEVSGSLHIFYKRKTTHKSVLSSFGGDKRDRTADLLNAIQALSQLSYTPIFACCQLPST